MLPAFDNRMGISCHISFQVRRDHNQFPLRIIQRVEALNRVLHKMGFERYNFSVCGQYIRIQGMETYNISPRNTPGPFKENFVTRKFEDKRLVVALMSLMNLLQNEGYIFGLNVSKLTIDEPTEPTDEERRDLWLSAQSIFLVTNGGEYEGQDIC